MPQINPREGSRFNEEDFVLAFRSRFGAELVDDANDLCRACDEPLDAQASHTLLLRTGAEYAMSL